MANRFDNRQEGYMGGKLWRGEGSGSTRGERERRYTDGPFTGVGPRGYQRPDKRIEEDVCERLMQHGHVDASQVEVSVDGGVVTLTGSVPTRHMKRMAGRVADSVPGVIDVDNELRITGPGPQSGQAQPYGDVHPGMEVVGRQGRPIGTIAEVRQQGFLVDRPVRGRVYIPFEYCQHINGNVVLKLSNDEVDGLNWSGSP